MNKTLLTLLVVLTTACLRPEQGKDLDYQTRVETVFRGSDKDFIWAQARAAVIPGTPRRAIMTLSKKLRSGSDVYFDLYETRSDDNGRTWTAPRVIPTLKIHEIENGFRRSMSDMNPQWHRKTGRGAEHRQVVFLHQQQRPPTAPAPRWPTRPTTRPPTAGGRFKPWPCPWPTMGP